MSQRAKFEVPPGVQPLPVVVPGRVVKLCQAFADASTKDKYEKRNNWSNLEKITADILIGKIAEFAAHAHLGGELDGAKLGKPDLEIYTVRGKSWATDLPAEGADWGVHVKAQGELSAKRYGSSWVFQAQDKRVFREPHPLDRVAFVRVGDVGAKGATCWVRGVFFVAQLHAAEAFKPTKVYPLSNKRAVYEEDFAAIGG